jgi:hypothetical protein
MDAVLDESAEVVEDVESVVRDSASDTGSSSLARFIPTPMDALLNCWFGVFELDFLGRCWSVRTEKKEGYEWQVRPGGALIYRLCCVGMA